MKRLHTYAQHFLRSPRLVGELVGHSNVRKNDTVLDLGAGSGVITSVLAKRAKQVIAVESEPRALASLRKNTVQFENVKVVAGDILTVTPPNDPYKIFSNIPFDISAQVVRKFTEYQHPPTALYLIVQKQFARKLVPGDDHFTSQLGAQLGPLYTVRIRRPLRRTDFTPPPGVDTVLLELKLREQPLLPIAQLAAYREFVARCFAEQKFFAKTPRTRSNISAELRPSQLILEQWIDLYLNLSVDDTY
jgi:23S rRNA (adenine-N6)-dimethyltransferase